MYEIKVKTWAAEEPRIEGSFDTREAAQAQLERILQRVDVLDAWIEVL